MALTNLETLAQVRDCAVKVARKIALDNPNSSQVLLDLEWMIENLDNVISSCVEKENKLPPGLKKAVDG